MNTLDFKTAFHYPFSRPKGLWNIFWIFVPIFGWFALGGFWLRLVQEFSQGKFTKLPLFSAVDDFKFGIIMFVKALPFMICYGIAIYILTALNPLMAQLINIVFEILCLPIIAIHFINKETVASYFDFKVINSVFNNLGDYVVAMLKTIGLGIIFLIMCIVLVGIPASLFSSYIFMADFYRRNVKN